MRIHFTPLDLARTHVASGPDAMWELVNSLQALQSRYGRSALGGWRQRVAEDLRRHGLATPVRERLFPIAPHASYFPDLLTPPEGALGHTAGIEAVLATPKHRLRTELARLPSRRGSSAWLADLAAGRVGGLTRLGNLLRAYHTYAVAPYRDSIATIVGNDIAARRTAASVGVEALLDSFRPMMRWQERVLDLPGHPSDRDVHLAGRGLLLVPSYFCQQHPVTIFDPGLPQVVVYPVDHRVGAPDQVDRRLPLHRLLGASRAAVLLATRTGATTGELAERLRISAATISHHTAVLRDAQLIVSKRSANTVRHATTYLGDRLIYQCHAE